MWIDYVDYIIITGDDEKGIHELKDFLQRELHTKDLGKLRSFLGINVARSNIIHLSQRKYVFDILEDNPNIKLSIKGTL